VLHAVSHLVVWVIVSVPHEKCILSFALNVELRHRCHSCQRMIARSTAVPAMTRFVSLAINAMLFASLLFS